MLIVISNYSNKKEIKVAKKISDKKIESKIRIPKNLPIDIDKKSYLRKNVILIRRELDKGMSLDRAVKKVTGYSPQDTKRKRGGNSISLSLDNNKIIFITIAIMLVIASSLLYVLNLYKPHTTSAIGQEELQGTNQNEMILVAGLDTRPEVDNGSGTNKDVPGTRTDMLALISIPEDGSRATVVSIPRDTSVTRSECNQYNAENNTYNNITESSEDNVKINSVYGVGGPRCLVETINDNLDININRYMEINFDIFEKVVDAMGGIQITSDKPIIDDTLGTIISKPGTYNLDGKKSLDYVRARKVEGTSKSDFDRIKRQQNFFRAVVDKLFKENKVKDPQFISNIAKDVLPYIKEDNVGMNEFAQLGYTLSKLDKNSLRMTTLPIKDEDIMGNLLIDEDKTTVLFDALKNNTPLRGEITNNNVENLEATIKNISDLKITIISKSEYDERTLRLKNFIESKNGSVSIVTSDDIPRDSTVYADNKNYNSVATIAEMFPDISITTIDSPVKKSSSDSIVITIGSNADNVFNSPQKNNKGRKYIISPFFEGMGYDMIPREIPGISS